MPQRSIKARDALTPRSLAVREAHPDETPSIVGVINRAYKPRDWFIFEQLRTSIDGYPLELERRRSVGLVGELDGAIVAHVCLHIDPPEAEFGLLATAPEVQGRGIAATMIAECERRARAAGCRTMALDAVEEVGMRPYYESLGYTLVRREEHSSEWNAKVPWTHIFMSKVLS